MDILIGGIIGYKLNKLINEKNSIIIKQQREIRRLKKKNNIQNREND